VRALHAAGVRSGIRVDALEVALMGATRRHFADAVRILRDVVNDGGFNSPRIADLANEVLNEYGIEFRDEFNYFMGRYFYDAGELTQALRFLTEVSPTGEFGARALFLSAVVLVNPEIGENIRAVQNLEAAITHADRDSETDQEVVENAYLALARIAYQVGNFGGALYYYHQIPAESPRWTTALFESAWTYFLAGDLNRAVGNFHSLHSPYHNHRFYPDLWVLEAAAYLYSCNIDEARAAVATFDEEVAVLRDVLREFVAEATDPMVYYRVVYEPTRSREIGDPALPEEAIDTVLGDIDLRNQHGIIQQLEREIAIFRAAGDSLGERGETTLELLETELGNRRLEAAVVVHDVIDDLIRELDDWWFKAQEVRIEIGDLETQYLQAILAEGESAITEGTTFFVVADDWQFWPWEGEYWLDEVGNYRGNLTTRCPDVVEF
jgi:tetratricopeptide (TPR) repeat protein